MYLVSLLKKCSISYNQWQRKYHNITLTELPKTKYNKHFCPKFVSHMQVIAEALGTFMLVFSIYGIIASTQIMRGQVGLLEYAVTASLAVIVVVFSIGGISGAHINPAVTIAFATAGPFPWSKVLINLQQLQYPKCLSPKF